MFSWFSIRNWTQNSVNCNPISSMFIEIRSKYTFILPWIDLTFSTWNRLFVCLANLGWVIKVWPCFLSLMQFYYLWWFGEHVSLHCMCFKRKTKLSRRSIYPEISFGIQTFMSPLCYSTHGFFKGISLTGMRKDWKDLCVQKSFCVICFLCFSLSRISHPPLFFITFYFLTCG